jgi:septal ring factor EnvC (AmiA/AmiB activator)
MKINTREHDTIFFVIILKSNDYVDNGQNEIYQKDSLEVFMRKISMIVFVLVAFGLSGCAIKYLPPSSQLTIAASAISQAEKAGAYESAPVELKAARKKLEQAKESMKNQDNLTAKWLAEQATVDANLAEAKARSIKSQKTVQEIKESIETLKKEIERKSVR